MGEGGRKRWGAVERWGVAWTTGVATKHRAVLTLPVSSPSRHTPSASTAVLPSHRLLC